MENRKNIPVRRCTSSFIEDKPKPVKSLCTLHNIRSSERDNHDSCKKIKSWLLHNASSSTIDVFKFLQLKDHKLIVVAAITDITNNK